MSTAAHRVDSLPPDVLAAEELIHVRGWHPDDVARRAGMSRAALDALLDTGRAARQALARARAESGDDARMHLPSGPRAFSSAVDLALEGMPPREIALALGIPAGRVHVRLNAARAAGLEVPWFKRGRKLPL